MRLHGDIERRATEHFLVREDIKDRFAKADLATDSIFDYPLLIMTGEGAFELTDDEVTRLRSFLSRGGILLASAGCSRKALIRAAVFAAGGKGKRATTPAAAPTTRA